jgi:multiple sugar transport system substrate-binding protein
MYKDNALYIKDNDSVFNNYYGGISVLKKSIIFIMVCLLLLLSACGSASKNSSTGNSDSPTNAPASDDSDKKQVEITFAETLPSQGRTEVLKGIIDDFQKQNPNIKVNFVSMPVEQSRDKLITQAVAKQLPDVFELNNSWIGPLVVNKGLEDMQPYFDKFPNKDDFSKSAIDLGKSYGNTLYWIPYGTYGLAVYYNKQMFQDAGLQAPKTIQEFYDDAKILTHPEKNQYGYAFRGGIYGFTHTLMWMMSTAGTNSMFDANGKSILDSPKAIEGLKNYAKLFTDQVSPPDSLNWSYKEDVASFTTGNTAMLIQSNEVVGISTEKMGAGKFDTAMLPLGPSGQQYDTSGQTGWAMASTSKNKEAAAKLIQFLMSPEGNLKFVQYGGFTPVLKSLQNDPTFSEGPIKVYKDQINSSNITFANLPTFLPEWSDLIGPFSTSEVQKLLLKKQTAEETAKNLSDYMNKAMDKWNSSQK